MISDETLKKNQLFHGIRQEELQSMMKCLNAQIREYRKGEMIFCEGDPTDYVGAVLAGNVWLVKDDFYGNRSIVASLGETELFGEAFSCAEVKKLPIGVYANTDVTVMLMDCKRILQTCSNACAFHATLIRNLLRVVAKKNLVLNQKIEFISKKTTKEKVMAFLMAQAKEQQSNTFTIPFDRQSLADYLGVERSAMSAEIGKLRDQGYLEVDRKKFRLLKEFEQ